MITVADKAAAAVVMKRLRKRRGLSLLGAAKALTDIAAKLNQHLPALPSVQRTVARWETAKPTVPDDRYQLLLAHLYARNPSGDLALGSGSDFTELLEAFRLFGESEGKITELRSWLVRAATDQGASMLALLPLGVQGGLAAALADPSRTDAEVVAGLAEVVADVNAQVGSLPFVRLQLVLAPVVEACRRLLSGEVDELLLPELRSIAVTASTLAGRLAFETRDDGASRSLYAEATREAALLGQSWRQAGVHMSHALVTLYSEKGIDGARNLVDQAVRVARTGDSMLARARAHALQAEIAARAGQERQARAALGLAWYDMQADHTGDPSPSSFRDGHLRGFEGVCELYVGDASAAHDQFARSAAALSAPREQVQRAIVTTDQALARIRMDDPRAAAELLHDCVNATSTTGGRVPAIRLRRARQQLRPWRQELWVAELDDHLMDMLGS